MQHTAGGGDGTPMPRYLTPARVCLLLLIRLYQSGCCASDVHLLDFVARHMDDAAAIHQRTALSAPHLTALASTLQQWRSHPGPTVYDALVRSVWEQVGSLHSFLHLFTARITSWTRPGPGPDNPHFPRRPITPASPVGRFVRRCHVEFVRLPFANAQSLWRAFESYRAPTFDHLARTSPDAAQSFREHEEADSLRPALSSSAGLATAASVDADVLLAYSIHQLQKLGQRVPEDIKSTLSQWMEDECDAGTQSLHIFMTFFEHWRAGEYTMALESLHRYFDYSLAARPGAGNVKAHYQYALLHLSVLHADFECWEESVDAMNECIATARENQDAACLNFALSWLLYLRHGRPGRNAAGFGSISGYIGSHDGDQDEIRFLKQRASESEHWMLMSSALMEEARMEMLTAGSASRAHEHLIQSLFLSVKHDLRTLIPAALLFQGSCLDRLGQAHIAKRTYELSDAVHAAHCPTSDRVRSRYRLALAASHSGNASAALQLLERLSPAIKGLLKSEQKVKAFTALIHLRSRIRQGDSEAAEYCLHQFRPFRSSADPEIAYEVDILEVELLIKDQLYEDAFHKVAARLDDLQGDGTDLAQRLHFMLLKARIFALAGQAPKGFSIALRATSTAERHLLLPMLLEGLATLARILIELGEFNMATALCEAALPHAFETPNTALTARLFVTMGEAAVGRAGHGCAMGSPEQVRSMREAFNLIDRGREMYRKVGDLQGQMDCLLMKSRIASWSDDATSVAQADDTYMQLLAEKERRPTTPVSQASDAMDMALLAGLEDDAPSIPHADDMYRQLLAEQEDDATSVSQASDHMHSQLVAELEDDATSVSQADDMYMPFLAGQEDWE